MSILSNRCRHGNFTSSQISNLLTVDKSGKNFGKPALTYIQEKNFERLIGCNLGTDIDAKATTWGKVLESRVFDLLGLSYSLTSQETDTHPEYDYWVGSKDGLNHSDSGKAVIDIKCPITRKSFIQLVLPFYAGEENPMDCIVNGWEYKGMKVEPHKSGDDYYWQLVSNACINGTDWAELVVYMPYKHELQAIRNIGDQEGIWWLKNDDLPYLPKGGVFQNITVIRFQVPQSDKDLLTSKVAEAGKMLVERNSEFEL
jgi:hypothetical protein